MTEDEIAARVEGFVRQRFNVAVSDPHFSRNVDLFDSGYVDSVGVVELIAFLESEFDVQIADEVLMSEEFMTINGIGRIVGSLDAR